MQEISRDRASGYARARAGKLLLVATLMSAALTACGGDSDSAPTAAAPPATTPPPAAVAPPSSGASDSLIGVSSAPGTTTLSWTPPTANDDGTPLTLTGYKIYWGLAEDNYSHSVTLENPGLTRHVVEQLPTDTWYFVATALSADGESPPSNVVRMQVR